MSDQLAWAIAIMRNHVDILHKIAPNDKWQENELYQRWQNWHSRQFLSDEEYLKLEDFLRRCCDRAVQLRQEKQQCTR